MFMARRSTAKNVRISGKAYVSGNAVVASPQDVRLLTPMPDASAHYNRLTAMDGLLVVDKPIGPTSHDVVARMRRALRESRIGHTGTLDPMASGVLPLVLGRATRLARFLSTSDKRYTATVRLGISTDTYDAMGEAIGPAHPGPVPDRATLDDVLDRFRGTFLQQPPAFSAKKVGGQRSYTLARARARSRQDDMPPETSALTVDAPALPAPVAVTTQHLQLLAIDGDLVTLDVICSAGFYVRSLAHDLGQALGMGAHLSALRRTETSGLTLSHAVALEHLADEVDGPGRVQDALMTMEAMLPTLSRIDLTEEGAARVSKGRDLAPAHTSGLFPSASGSGSSPSFRLFDPAGRLIAIAEPTVGGLLHPAVVLM
jgi:tRNA pseudouridine55 synthase